MKKKSKNIGAKELAPFVDNILNLSMYGLRKSDVNFINHTIGEYFLTHSNKFYSSTIDRKLVGVLLGSTNKEYKIDFDWSILKEADTNQKNRDAMKLQVRIFNAIASNKPKNYGAELICFSILDEFKGRGLGKNLITLFENDLIREGINSYILFTDQNCDYEWYNKNGYRLLQSIKINIDDLPTINKVNKKYVVMLYKKEII